MAYNIVRDAASKSYFIAGRGHSWGSFKTWGEANAFVQKVEAENRAFRSQMIARQAEARLRFEEQDRLWVEAQRARKAADRLLYEGGRSSDDQEYLAAVAVADEIGRRCRECRSFI